MAPEIRQAYNAAFTEARYLEMLDWIAAQYDHRPPFKIAETPVFVPRDFKAQLFAACEDITRVLTRPDFRELSQGAVPDGHNVPGETPHPTFLVLDFGVCRDAEGRLTPQLIEMQGFPSLYCYQRLMAAAYRRHFDIPENYSYLFGGLDDQRYIETLRRIIVGDHDPANVILLEIEPDKQPTAIDFIATKHLLGIEYVCISKLKVEGRKVYYFKDGKKTPVERIYNRVIFDELDRRGDLPREFHFSREYDVEWAGHPNWFFRISKHTLPLLDNPHVPKSHFLHQLKELPDDLHNYVLKPLYSFAGAGVILHLDRAVIDAIEHRAHYILQRKVEYAGVIPTPDVPAKCEIRLMLLWENGAARPYTAVNLVRLSKGEMIGTRYNKDKNWVGGSVGFFEI